MSHVLAREVRGATKTNSNHSLAIVFARTALVAACTTDGETPAIFDVTSNTLTHKKCQFCICTRVTFRLMRAKAEPAPVGVDDAIPTQDIKSNKSIIPVSYLFMNMLYSDRSSPFRPHDAPIFLIGLKGLSLTHQDQLRRFSIDTLASRTACICLFLLRKQRRWRSSSSNCHGHGLVSRLAAFTPMSQIQYFGHVVN